MNPTTHSIKIERITKMLFLVVTIILPFFFLPKLPIGLDATKGFAFSFIVLLCFVGWLLARLIDARIHIPKTPIIKHMGWFVASFTLAAFFSPVIHKSFWGYGFESGTAFSVIVLAIYGFLAVQYLQEITIVRKLYGWLLASFIVTTLFSFTSFFFGQTRLFKMLQLTNTSFVGSWNDLAIFSGGVGMVVLLALYTTQMSRTKKLFSHLVLGISLVALALINFSSIWLMLGVFALLVFVYILTVSPAGQSADTPRKIPTAPFFVIIICLLFLLGNTLVSRFVVSQTGFVNIDVKPTLSATATVFGNIAVKDSLHMLFGFGPNRFSNAWALYHPLTVNQTDFWNTSFSAGYGLIPTIAITGGIVSFIAILLFFIVFLLTGIRLVFRNLRERDFNFWVTSSFLGALYLWVCCFVYTSSLSIMMLTFLFTALFVATLRERQLIAVRTITYLDDPRKSFFGISFIVVLLVCSISVLYLSAEKYTALYFFGKGVVANQVADSEKYLLRAVSLNPHNEFYYKGLSSFYLNQFNTAIASQNPDQKIIQNSYELARSYAEIVVKKVDATSAENWKSLGDIYAIGLRLKNTEAYQYAVETYQKARVYDSKNPSTVLLLAQLEYTNQDYEKTVQYINTALSLKINYIDAYLLLARVNHAQNKNDEAIKNLQTIVYYYPSNAVALRAVGATAFDIGLYTQATNYLENSFLLDNSSLETAGLLVRVYRKTGNNEKAIAMLESLRNAFVGNDTMQKAIDQLDSGTKQSPSPVVEQPKTTKTTKK